MTRPGSFRILAVFMSALALTGCGMGEGTDAEGLASLFQRGGYSADYEPAASPNELSLRSDLVVEGDVVDFIKGREFGRSSDDPGMALNITMVVEVDSTLSGPPAKKVFVELPSPGNIPASKYKKPRGPFPVVLYLSPAERPEIVVDANAGRPKGESLYRPTTPQGFIAQTDHGALQVLDFEEFQGSSLEQFYPELTVYPEPSSPSEGAKP